MREQEQTRILIIDDDQSIRETLSKALEKAGYVVDTAEDGAEAIEKAQANFYNLALIDIRLPDIEGTKLLTAMKDTTPKMAKIILTGYPALENAIEAVNKGADSYVRKPVDIGELLRVIKKHLEKQAEARVYSQEKVKEFIETRVKQLETEEQSTRNNAAARRRP
jgi:DNA-binding NtrC family response regulator